MTATTKSAPRGGIGPGKVLLVTGSYPPDACGVGDHSHGLVEGLARAGVPVTVYCRKDWSVFTVLKHYRAWRAARVDAIILVHPTDGYRKSPAPNFALSLPLRARKLVILHEYTRKSLAGKLACYLFFLFADRIAFTSEIEQDAAVGAAPWIGRRTAVIPLPSNIPVRDRQAPRIDVAYFGLIRPGKGIEEFLDMLEAATLPATTRIRLIGQSVTGLEDYAVAIGARLTALGGEMMTNLSATEVADLLAATRVVALAFPDGISRRRSSALAAMANGALVLTTPARNDHDLFDRICVMAPDAGAMAGRLVEVLADPDRFRSVADAGMAFARSQTWDMVVSACQDLIWTGD